LLASEQSGPLHAGAPPPVPPAVPTLVEATVVLPLGGSGVAFPPVLFEHPSVVKPTATADAEMQERMGMMRMVLLRQ
jgi:hypothetical protein